MGRHNDQKEAVLSPRVIEGVNHPSHFTGQNEHKRTEMSSFQDPKRQTEHLYGKNTHIRSKSSSFQDHHP